MFWLLIRTPGAVFLWLLPLPILCRQRDGLSKHTHTHAQKYRISSCPRSWLPSYVHLEEVKGRADWNVLGKKLWSLKIKRTIECFVARDGCLLPNEALCSDSSTSFPGCSSLKTLVWRNQKKMDYVGQPKTKGAWNFQNGQKRICKVPLRNWQKRDYVKDHTFSTNKCHWNFKKPVWFFWPQCVEVRGSVGEVIWSSFLFPSSRISPALGTPFTLVSGSWLSSFLFCFAQALEIVASCKTPTLECVTVEALLSVLV